MRPSMPSVKQAFFGLLLALSAQAAVAQTTVEISGFPADAAEGSGGGTTAFTFTLTRSGPALAFNVTYTITGDVLAPEDYNALSGTVAFTAAQTTRTITVGIKKDTKFEIHENLTLTLVGADNGASLGATTVDTTQVTNDDLPPTVSVGNLTVGEATATANLAVTLSNASYQTVTVTATTANGTASDVAVGVFPKDYTANTGTVTFNPGVVFQTFGVSINNDLVYEPGGPETFTVGLTAPSNATLGTATGTGSITDNEVLPSILSVTSPGSQAENVASYTFTVTLNRRSTQTITVQAETLTGTAQDSMGLFFVPDYDAIAGAPGVLTFLPGEIAKAISVNVHDDTISELTENFSLRATGLTNVNPGPVTRVAQIVDFGDPLALLEVTDFSVSEGAGTASYTITLNTKSGRPIQASAATTASGSSATAGSDYTATGPQVFTWSPGDNTSRTFIVPITEDNVYENNETVRVLLSGIANAGLTAGGGDALATIVENETIPSISITDVSLNEGSLPATPTTTFTFTISLSGPSSFTSTFKAITANGTATTADSDYVSRPLTNLSFAPLATAQTFDVTVNGNNVAELDETFFVNLSAPGATVTIADPQGVGTILNDDSPVLTIDPASVIEGNSGTVALNFNVHIPDPAPFGGVSFTYVTSDGTATTADNDYIPVVAGTGFIPAGGTNVPVTVDVNGDTGVEGHETLTVTISSPVVVIGVATIAGTGMATGTINNDDVVANSLKISEFRLRGPAGAEDEFIEVANITASPITVLSTGASATGFSVARDGDVLVFTIPDGTVIPAYGHYLGVNSTGGTGYSLAGFAGGDASWTADIGDDTGLALFSTNNPADFGAATAFDAVGFTTSAGVYFEGAKLAPLGAVVTANYSFVRKFPYAGGAVLQDTIDNATDFALVAVDPATYGGPTSAVLGGPSPENLASETERDNTEIAMTLYDAAFTESSAPNYLFTAASTGVNSKFIELRRKMTANANFGSVRFKVTSLSTLNDNNGGLQADFRPTTSSDVVPPSYADTAYGLLLENGGPVGYSTLLVPDATSVMGGLNSTLRLPQPLVAATPLAVNFKIFYTTSGKPGYFWVTPEAKP